MAISASEGNEEVVAQTVMVTADSAERNGDVAVAQAMMVIADSAERNDDEADEETDSELDDSDTRKTRKSNAGVRKPCISRHTIDVMDRDVMNDQEIQARLTEFAKV